MKKTIYVVGILALSTLVLSSCDKDDEDNNGSNNSFNYATSTQKRLTSLTDKDHSIYYEYDSHGRLIKSLGYNPDVEYAFDGKSFSAIHTVDRGGKYEKTFTTKGELDSRGFITTEQYEDGVNDIYSYDKDGHLISVELDEEVTLSFKWENGNVISQKRDFLDEVIAFRYEYTNEDVKTPIENKATGQIYVMNGLMDLAMRALYGVGPKYLPVTKISEDGETTKYDWTLDTDGYPIKLIKSSIDRGNADTTIFNWE